MIINSKKHPVVQGFQLDDTFDGHRSLYNILGRFLAEHPDSTLFAGMESTGGYENNWYNSLIEFQGSLNIQTARLNLLGVMYNSKADLKKAVAKQTMRMINECSIPEIELLKTFPGISDLSAVGLIIEIQTIKRFAEAKKLASFFGVHPVYKISGDGVGSFKMSKQVCNFK